MLLYGEWIEQNVFAADGVFGADGRFIAFPPVPEALLAEGFRRAVLAFLVKAGAIANELREKSGTSR